MTGKFDMYIRKAMTDLKGKTLNQIQIETAMVWCGRACAAALLGAHDDAHEYAHEAIEHAALSGNDALLRDVRSELASHGIVL